MNRRLLVVCTANLCRSPVAQQLFQRRLGAMEGNDCRSWTVSSAGVSSFCAPADVNTAAAARAAGLDLHSHTPRRLDRDLLLSDGADLVVTMTRAQLRDVIGLDTAWWPRTFTLRELVRRARQVAPASADEDLHGWLARVATGRRATDMLKPDPDDDISDPYGAPRAAHDVMVRELADLVDEVVQLGPWRRRAAGE